ncbi:hypothetical protein BRC61_02020 [Halobacteriales archaeon QH_10_65_19]|nr:MAG: hypothetical protein BRC61_02020 [Halobacteriales archaeon QH_10_65_19]
MIVSVHRYELAPTGTGSEFRDAGAAAVDRVLFESNLGLIEYRLGRVLLPAPGPETLPGGSGQ